MNSISGTSVNKVEQYSQVFFSFPRRAGETGEYEFTFTAESPDRYNVDAYLKINDVWQRVSEGLAQGESPSATLNFSATEETGEIVVIVSNITDGNYDSDTSGWIGRGFSYDFKKL